MSKTIFNVMTLYLTANRNHNQNPITSTSTTKYVGQIGDNNNNKVNCKLIIIRVHYNLNSKTSIAE